MYIKSYDTITKSFTKIIKDLETLAADRSKKQVGNQVFIDDLIEENAMFGVEIGRAKKLRDKLSELIGE